MKKWEYVDDVYETKHGIVIVTKSYALYMPWHVVERTPLKDVIDDGVENLGTYKLAVIPPESENVWFGYKVIMWNPCNADVDEVYVLSAEYAPGHVDEALKYVYMHIHFVGWIQRCVRARL